VWAPWQLKASCAGAPRPLTSIQELERKSDAFNAERRKATDTILDLQRRLAEAESTAQRLQADNTRLAQKLEAQRQAAEVGAC
jgi:chromosome segregation ATPase